MSIDAQAEHAIPRACDSADDFPPLAPGRDVGRDVARQPIRAMIAQPPC
jgi:hypothetical protein